MGEPRGGDPLPGALLEALGTNIAHANQLYIRPRGNGARVADAASAHSDDPEPKPFHPLFSSSQGCSAPMGGYSSGIAIIAAARGNGKRRV